jgi:hypothetical protein
MHLFNPAKGFRMKKIILQVLMLSSLMWVGIACTENSTTTSPAAPTLTPTVTPTQVTFTYIYTTYIQPNSCVNCHTAPDGPPDPSSQSNFYNSVVNQSAPDGCASLLVSPGNANQSALYLRLVGGSCSPQMPESGGFVLSAAQLANVAAWINAGALNN